MDNTTVRVSLSNEMILESTRSPLAHLEGLWFSGSRANQTSSGWPI